MRRLHSRIGWAVLVLITIAVVCLALWVTRRGTDRDELLASEEAIQEWDFAEASDHLARYLEQCPDDVDVLLMAASTARRAGDFELSARYLLQCLDQQAATEGALFEIDLWRAQQGDFRHKQQELISLARSDDSRSDLVLEAMALGLANIHHFPPAEATLSMLLERTPEHVAALSSRAKIYGIAGAHERALHDLQRAVEIVPHHQEIRRQLADCYRELGYVRKAIYHYKMVIASTKEDAEATLGLAICQHVSGNLREAESLLDRLLELQPQHVDGLIERTRVALHQGQADQAIIWARRAYDLNRSHPESYLALLQCLDALGNHDEANEVRVQVQAYEAAQARVTKLKLLASQHGENHLPTLRKLASALLESGKNEEAESWFFTTLYFAPDDAETRKVLAEHFKQTGQSSRARLLCRFVR